MMTRNPRSPPHPLPCLRWAGARRRQAGGQGQREPADRYGSGRCGGGKGTGKNAHSRCGRMALRRARDLFRFQPSDWRRRGPGQYVGGRVPFRLQGRTDPHPYPPLRRRSRSFARRHGEPGRRFGAAAGMGPVPGYPVHRNAGGKKATDLVRAPQRADHGGPGAAEHPAGRGRLGVAAAGHPRPRDLHAGTARRLSFASAS